MLRKLFIKDGTYRDGSALGRHADKRILNFDLRMNRSAPLGMCRSGKLSSIELYLTINVHLTCHHFKILCKAGAASTSG